MKRMPICSYYHEEIINFTKVLTILKKINKNHTNNHNNSYII